MAIIKNIKHLTQAIYLPSFFTGMAQNSLSVMLPLYVLFLGFGADVAAIIFGCRAFGGLAGSIPTGKFITKYGERNSILLGSTMLTLGYTAIGLTTNIWLLATFSFLLGFGAPLNQIGRQVYLTERFPPHERGRIIATMGGVMRIGTIVGPFIGGFVAAAYSYNMVFFGMAGVCSIALVLASIYAEKSLIHSFSEDEVEQKSWGILLQYKHIFLTAGTCMIALRLVRAARHLLIPLIGAHMGLEVEVIASIVAAGALLDALMFYPAGLVMDKFGRKFAAIPTYLLFFIGLTCLSFVETEGELLALSLLMGFGNGLSTGILFILGSDYAPRINRGRFLGVWRVISDFGAAGAPAVISIIIKAGSLLASGVATGSVALVAAGMMYYLIKEPLIKSDRETIE